MYAQPTKRKQIDRTAPNKYSPFLPKYAKITGNGEKPIKNIRTRAHNISITYRSTQKDRGRKKHSQTFRQIIEVFDTLWIVWFFVSFLNVYAPFACYYLLLTHFMPTRGRCKPSAHTYARTFDAYYYVIIFEFFSQAQYAGELAVCVCARAREIVQIHSTISQKKKQRRTANL